jgi:5-methylcytosine-specific restriction endonuclease McrA
MDFHVGHIVSRASGGSDEMSNLRAICGACNVSQGTRHMEAFAGMLN